MPSVLILLVEAELAVVALPVLVMCLAVLVLVVPALGYVTVVLRFVVVQKLQKQQKELEGLFFSWYYLPLSYQRHKLCSGCSIAFECANEFACEHY